MVHAQWDNLRTWNNRIVLIMSDTVIAVLYSKIHQYQLYQCSAAGKAEISCISHLLPVPREMLIKILLPLQIHRMKILFSKVFYLSHYCITPGFSSEHFFLPFKKFLCCTCRAESAAGKWTLLFSWSWTATAHNRHSPVSFWSLLQEWRQGGRGHDKNSVCTNQDQYAGMTS